MAALPNQTFFPDDLVHLSGSPLQIGIVDATPNSAGSETWLDKAHFDRHSNTPPPIFQEFLETRLIPAGYVLVTWQFENNVTVLLPEADCVLLDRRFSVSHVVKRRVEDEMTGVVVKGDVVVDLAPVRVWPDLATAKADKDLTNFDAILTGIPTHEVQTSNRYFEEDVVVYQDWVGRVSDTIDEVKIRLSNGAVVVPEEMDFTNLNEEKYPLYQIGDVVETKKGNLRRGRWIYGAYNANIQPKGVIVEVRTMGLEVEWLSPKDWTANPWSDPPPIDLDEDVMESGDVRKYDMDDASMFNWDYPGVRVRFKDIAGAAVKYPAINRIPRGDTLGYDMNVFTIVRQRSRVKVLWQDLSTSEHASTDLIPCDEEPDDTELWPGTVVYKDAKDRVDDTGAFKPTEVGIVQAVRASDRIAEVQWYPEAQITTHPDEVEEQFYLTGRSLGASTTGPTEESVYNLEELSSMSQLPGELVVITPEYAKNISLDPDEGPNPVNWVGTVVGVGIGGSQTVRLGMLKKAREISVPREALYVTNIEDDDGDDEDSDVSYVDESEDDEEGTYDIEIPEAFGGGSFSMFGLPAGLRQYVEHAVGRGDPMDVDMDEDEDDDDDHSWTTATDTDDEMPDLEEVSDAEDEMRPSEPLNGTVTKGEETQQQTASLPSPQAGPPQFDVLDIDPPSDHHYLSSPSRTRSNLLRTIRNEHTILSTSLPQGIYVRTFSSRLDLLRVLILGPSGTPYVHAPFIFDIHLPPTYPQTPPDVFFHSWTNGTGPVNPNLYEDGKICLSLLGTWQGNEEHERWNPGKSTVLQVLVSILGLVLVKDPYFNEAGFENRRGRVESRVPSRRYSERVLLLSRAFVTNALEGKVGTAGLEDAIRWVYLRKQPADGVAETGKEEGEPLLDVVIRDLESIIKESADAGDEDLDGISRVSKGAVVMLDKQLDSLREVREKTA